MKFILGIKSEMTQIFNGDKVVPVTKVKAGPCLITQIKSVDKDGYLAVQIGFGKKKQNTKSLDGHLKKASPEATKLRYLKEFRIKTDNDFKVGDEIKVDVFKIGDKVNVTGIVKGRGFQGVVKRHGFHGSPASHGHKDQLRMPGSIGAGGMAKVFKGQKMGGRMGGNQKTVKSLEVMEIDAQNNILLIKGAIPGAKNSLLEIAG
jgi:large subunit ribosomal protein L3